MLGQGPGLASMTFIKIRKHMGDPNVHTPPSGALGLAVPVTTQHSLCSKGPEGPASSAQSSHSEDEVCPRGLGTGTAGTRVEPSHGPWNSPDLQKGTTRALKSEGDTASPGDPNEDPQHVHVRGREPLQD